MQLCGKCGHYSSDESIFCGHCSNRLNNRCLQCNYPNMMQQKFCGNCGRQLMDDAELPGSARRYGMPPVSESVPRDLPMQGTVPLELATPKAMPPTMTSPSAGLASQSARLSEPTHAEPPSPPRDMPPLDPLRSSLQQADIQTIERLAVATHALPATDYALVSMEFANWDHAVSTQANPLPMEEARTHYLSAIAQHITQGGGHVSSSKRGVLFASFPVESGLKFSIQHALNVCFPLLSEEFRFGATALQLRIGLDIEHANDRNPLTSTLERSMGQGGTIILSEAAYYQLLMDAPQDLPADVIGPVLVGEQRMRFFRLPATAPVAQTPPPPAIVSPTPSSASQDDLESMWESMPVMPEPSAPPPAPLSDSSLVWPDFPEVPGQPVSSAPAVTPEPENIAPFFQEEPPYLEAEALPVATASFPETPPLPPPTLPSGFALFEPESSAFEVPTSDVPPSDVSRPAPLPMPVVELTSPSLQPEALEEPVVEPPLSFWQSAGSRPEPPMDPFAGDDVFDAITPPWTPSPSTSHPQRESLSAESFSSAPPVLQASAPQQRISFQETLQQQQGTAPGTTGEATELGLYASETSFSQNVYGVSPPQQPAESFSQSVRKTSDGPAFSSAPGGQSQKASVEANRAPQSLEKSKPLPVYEPPVLARQGALRSPNIRYGDVGEALATELNLFLEEGLAAKGRVLTLCGTDGLGKSSMIGMARSMVDPDGQRAIWMGGHCSRTYAKQSLPLFYWLELLQNLLGLALEGQRQADVLQQCEQFLAQVYEGEVQPEDSQCLLTFLSVERPQPLSLEVREHQDRLLHFFQRLFRKLANQRPLILVLEDAMFADAASLELLARLLEDPIPGLPFYVLVSQTRDFEAEGAWAAALQKLPCKELVVADMAELETARFLDDGPLGGRLEEFPPPLIESLYYSSHGSPLFLEEGLRLLHVRELITVDANTHKFVMQREFHPSDSALPDNLHDLTQERLRYLDETTLYALRLASVLGEKFALNLLLALSQMNEQEFNQSLTTLFNHGYLMPDVLNTGRFRHGLLWESVYETMDAHLRVQMHQLVSEALENEFNQGVTVNPLLVAYHSQAGQLPNRALNYWNLGGIVAGQIGALTAMNMAMFRALDVLLQTTSEPLASQEMALRTLENIGAFNLEQHPPLAVEVLEWVLYHRQRQGDFTQLIEPLGFLASAYEGQGQVSQALETLDQAVALLDPQTYPLETASLQINRLEYLVTLGRLQEARNVMDSSIDAVADQQGYEQGDPDFFAAYLQARLFKAEIMLGQCDASAMPILEACLRYAKERQLDGLVIALQLTMAKALLRQGHYEACNRAADTLLSAIEALDDGDWFLAQWGLLAITYHGEMEDWESAAQLVLTVIAKSEEVKDYHTWVVAQIYAGYTAGKSGKIKEARQLLEQAIGLASDYRFASAALLGWRLLADFEYALGNYDVAYDLASKALEVANKPDLRQIYEGVQLTLLCARILMAKGDIKPAGRMLETLWPQVVKARWQPLVAACAFEIGQLYKTLSQGAPPHLQKKHLMRSVEFFLKSKGIWLELHHLPKVRQIDALMPQL